MADLVALLVLAAKKGERLHPNGVPGQGVYFVAAEHDPTYAELGQAMARALGKKRATAWCTCRDRSCHWSGFAATRWGSCGNLPVG
ncbi:MAG: hypothetical protein H6Q51_2673 [Deltaproteobacteria bacterium]|nr:hypothetical protein [Deltaproteobacteria bacterium]